jgi:hypothetical protein
MRAAPSPPRAVTRPRLRAVVLVLVVSCAVLAGCGKSGHQLSGGEPAGAIPPVSAQGAVGVATKNTTRLGGADPVSDAAAVARAVYPGLTTATRPQAVVLVDAHDWAASLAASALASAPLGAPLLYSQGGALPEASLLALRAMSPIGAAALGGAQVIRIGTSVPVPAGLRTSTVPSAGGADGAATTAVAVESLLGLARGVSPRQVIVLAADASPALQMPAAGLAAESGAPILFVTAGSVPTATAAALRSLRRPAIYVIDPSAVGSRALAALARLGHVTPILVGSTPAEADRPTPVDNANAVARFTDGKFGWGVKEPGHGLVFANAGRPFDAPAAALLSASGDYGPLLLLESPNAVPAALARYLTDIQPAYGSAPQFQPVRGAYNHGWLIGDERAISVLTQTEIDSILEISPARASSEEEPSTTPTE